jgi:hypothetical protein
VTDNPCRVLQLGQVGPSTDIDLARLRVDERWVTVARLSLTDGTLADRWHKHNQTFGQIAQIHVLDGVVKHDLAVLR